MKRRTLLTSLLLVVNAYAQLSPGDLQTVLGGEALSPDAATLLIRQYMMKRVPPLPTPKSAAEWQSEATRIRTRVLNDVVFHGWPKAWVEAPPKFEDLGVMEAGKGYRIRKLRYEIVPGFYSTALLYEPDHLAGKVPAVLNVNGHCGDPGQQKVWEYPGKALEYKQKRCINMALRGMLALNLEWLGCGELFQAGNSHRFAAQLDLVGTSGVGLFYLAMRKGLDYLDGHPNVDRGRIGMTGLSGGGWQTITLSALDERVAVSVPVAGYSSFVSRVEREMDMGDNEQLASDLFAGQDYTHLTAMRAPRPSLLIYNSEDPCCFRASLVKPYVFDQVVPFYKLFNRQDAFAWHENMDPGTHNYQADNRQQAYEFFSKHFGLPEAGQEIPVDNEVKSFEDLKIGLPEDNLTILGLAQNLAREIRRDTIPSKPEERAAWVTAQRTKLKQVVRYRPVKVNHPWAITGTKGKGVETKTYRFELSDGLSVTGVWVKAITNAQSAPPVIVLHDGGRKLAEPAIAAHVNRGEQVLALDLLFTGDSSPRPNVRWLYAILLAAAGDRPIGMEAAQLVGVAHWFAGAATAQQVRLDITGMRSQVTGMIAGAMAPDLFSEATIQDGITSLGHLIEAPVAFDAAPDLFCRDLFKYFDLDRLAFLARPMAAHTVEKDRQQ